MSKIEVNRKNHDKARKYFGILGNKDLDLHHKDETLMYTDPERYNEWRPEDLVVITHGEHTRYHQLQYKDRSNWNYATGKRNGANTHPEKNCFISNNPSYKGQPGTTNGYHWWTNGIENRFCPICPEGFIKGRI